MSQIQKIDEYRQQKILLIKNQLLEQRIQPNIVQGLSQYRSFLMSRIRMITSMFNYQDKFYSKIKIVMDILSKEYKQKSLVYVVKKCAFLHIYLHLMCEIGLINSEDIDLIANYINQLIKVDIPKLSQPDKKSSNTRNSIQKLYNYIRGNSESKRFEKSKSKLKMELTNDKGALKQLTSKVVLPLCSYFLKISQDYSLYSNILRKKINSGQQQQVRWKMMNYLGLLSSIVTELNRLGKYYKQDLEGCWVLLYYIMSLDINVYANIVAQSLGKLCQRWQQKIILLEKFSKISRNHRAELKKILQDQQFGQLVKKVEVLLEYKQKLLYIYFNSQIKPYLSYFQRPELVKKNSKYSEVFQFILSLASEANPTLPQTKPEIAKDQKDFNNKKTGEIIRKRMHSQPNQPPSSAASTIQSTLRERMPTDKPIQQKQHIFSTKNTVISNNQRTNNFIGAAKSRAMGK